MAKYYYVYVLTNANNYVLYTGVTNNLQRRLWEHKSGKADGFTKKYKCKKLVYYEYSESIGAAINREKQIKAGSRKKKLELINNFNPQWLDLGLEMF
ncbi:MAG: GIY-YIG nuclease family protein [Patescibacteria group bacterium]